MVDIDGDLIIDSAQTALKSQVVEHLDTVARFCGVDVFLLGPKFASLGDSQSLNERLLMYISPLGNAPHDEVMAFLD